MSYLFLSRNLYESTEKFKCTILKLPVKIDCLIMHPTDLHIAEFANQSVAKCTIFNDLSFSFEFAMN